MRLLAVLYDIHGNLPALEAVLEEARAAGAERWLLGGDYSAFGPWPRETLERLLELEDALWIRGNGERWLVEQEDWFGPDGPLERARRELAPEEIERLYGLPIRVELDGVLYVHGSPASDVESFRPEPQVGEERFLAGERERTIVFGHSHKQFRRPGPSRTDLVNPGSVGQPLDGDTRAAWALWRDGGELEFRRTEYDVERAVTRMRKLGGEWGEQVVRRLRLGSD